MGKKALIVMAKRPFPGQTKTRLVPSFTAEEAAELYGCFLRDTLELVRSVEGVTPFVAYAPADQETAEYFNWAAPDFRQAAQRGATLSERLEWVLSSCTAMGYTQVAAINSDSPNLPAAYLDEAFQRLDDPGTDVVFGPCDDGGYYLIGWKRPHPRLVREVKMSTDHVLADTLRIASEEGLNVSLLAPWYDVDNLVDLQRLQRELFTHKVGAEFTRRFLNERVERVEHAGRV